MNGNSSAEKAAKERQMYYKSVEESRVTPEATPDDYSEYQRRVEIVENRRKNIQEYNQFVDSIDKILLSEAFCRLFESIRHMQYTANPKNINMGKNMIRRFFNEATLVDLKRNMVEEHTLFLDDLLEAVKETHDEIMSTVDKNNTKTFSVDSDVLDNFYDNLDKHSFTDAADLIRSRVCMAVQDFVMKNKEDKMKMEELVANTKNNLDAMSQNPANESTETVDATNLVFKKRMRRIRERSKNLFESMVYANYETVLKEESLQEHFSEDGKISMDYIMEYTEIQYTIMEMFNTTKVDKVTEDQVKELLGI